MQHKLLKKLTAFIVSAAMLIASGGCAEEEKVPEEKTVENSVSRTADNSCTLMIYICAADLESEYGCATADINEILYGYSDSNLNIIIQTGGTLEWQNTVISGDRCQRYQVKEDGLELIDDTLGQQNMAEPDTLSDFVSYCTDNYTASRYGLILWDHGGGVIGGYGYDENFGGESMSLPQINQALDNAGTHFDFIGFDACLMATLETCLMASYHADYMIASEETEPGCGWYYTNWIESLSADCSLSPEVYGKQIIDDYVEYCYEDSPSMYSTLAMFDLNAVTESLLPALDSFSSDCSEQIAQGEYRVISQNRSNTRAVYQSDFDHIDLYDFAERSDTESSAVLAQAISDSIIYYRSTPNGSSDYGLSILFPYYDLSAVDEMTQIYDSLEYDTAYTDLTESFANVMAGGQISISSFSNTHNDIDENEYSEFSWFDSEDWYDDSYYETNCADLSELEVTDSDGQWVLELSDEDWEIVNDAAMQMFAVGEDYYIDMGLDDYCEFDDNGNLIVEYDQTWVALDGVVVPFFYEDYIEEEDYFLTYGYVPCIYNGEDAEIIVAWDSENDGGYVAGVRPVYDESVAAKGLYEVQDGDTFQLYYDIYDENLEYLDTITLDDEIFTVDGEITVSYEDVVSQLGNTFIYYVLEDVYNNTYFTESIWYEE